jgi:uncharacterized membrane protein YvlD (DUF360 family)
MTIKIYKGGILMEHDKENRRDDSNNNSIWGWVLRLIVVAVVLGITSFFTPGFTINGLWSYLIAALVITVLDYFAESFMGVDASPIGKGLKGFAIAAVIIYLAQFLVPHMRVTIIGALLAAAVIGIIDALLPGRIM